MLKRLKPLILLTVIAFGFVGYSNAHAKIAVEHISNFEVDISVNKDGTVDVIETIDYYFDSYRHGIYREIPLSKENQDGDAFLMSASSISVTNGRGVPWRYQDNSDSQMINLKIGDPDKTIIGANTYVISYTLSGAITYFSDHDEFYWNITGNSWEIPIHAASARIFVDSLNSDQLKDICFYGDYGENNSSCEVSREGNYVTISSPQMLDPYEGLTVAVSFPKGTIDVLEPIPDNSALIDQIIGIIMGILAFGYYLALPAYLIYKAVKRRKKNPEEKRVVAAWFDPPKTANGRPLTAGEVGVLHDRKGDIRDITATLIQLAQKGYFKIHSEEKGLLIKKPAFTLIKQKEWAMASDLMPYEIDLLDDIFLTKDSVELSELGKRIGFATKLDSAYKSISSQLVSDGLYEDDPHTHKQKWFALMFIGFFIFNPLFILAAYLMSIASRRTSLGGTAWATVESMKNFVKSQERQLEFQAQNQMFFEKLLPYATALGVEKVWIERFKDLKLAQPEWLETDNFNTFAYMNLMNSFNTSVSSAVSMSSTRSSSGFSSGFSGGGFSGGGGGGGGGGSW